MFKFIYKLLRKKRYTHIKKFLKGENILEIGSTDNYLKKIIRNKKILCTDVKKRKGVSEQNVEHLKLKDKSFDTVLCMEVLEHTENPLKAIMELKRVTKKRLIITVPNEPWFTFWRFMNWEKEHLWAIRPGVFRKYLGKPEHEEVFFLGRYYLGVWIFNEKKGNDT
jgi:SAM-dependent methyltransferase